MRNHPPLPLLSLPLLRIMSLLLLAGLGLLGTSQTVHADLLFGISSVSAAQGSTGNSFDVLLTNTGTSDLVINSFAFEITASTSDVEFMEVTTSTTAYAYIFVGYSTYAPDILLSGMGTNDVAASDLYSIANSGITLAASQTLALGHVVFDLAGSAPISPIDITFAAFPYTSVSDDVGNDYTNFVFPAAGTSQITVTPASAVPEPSSMTLFGLGLLAVVCSRRMKPSV